MCVLVWCVYLSCPQGQMHSYREAFEEMEDNPISPPPSSGGEAPPLTPAFPVSPQTPYFNLCKFFCSAGRGSRGSQQSTHKRRICL